MGIIKAGVSAMRGSAAAQWKDAFRAGELGNDLLFKRAKKIAGSSGGNSGAGEVITDGSVIIVGEGECAVATEGGKIVGIYDQPGEQIFRSDQSKGIFSGGLSALMKDVGHRISFGGEVAISQRLYYINTKEITGGTIQAVGVPLRFRDDRAGVDIDGGVSCSGTYTFRIADPERFFNAAIRSSEVHYRGELLKQMDSEVLTSLAPALAQLTKAGVRPNELMRHTGALCEELRRVMSDQWSGLRGIEVASVALSSVTVLDAAMIRELQRNASLKDSTLAAAYMVGSTGAAMQAAAANESAGAAAAGAAVGILAAQNDEWTCSCGFTNRGKYCTDCGSKRPLIPAQ